ncbi:DUF397 domain-containing protein [Saccharopolyspora hirsuta]|uniref:DUF397 domain-containing protein n=1 Tax=Saccharopolyspora hirsuta TaxID=1837 RepID=A0A5M7C8S1_SACHI|nr:DUF397 domain-containing protein [Saccharopolyspora hirsuta]KAA5836054.1 DUF397 domain-containing protein [Saccharopolyspora hirsuta]
MHQHLKGWRKSSHSTQQSACVEVAINGSSAGIRDSKLGEQSPVLLLSAPSWAAFLTKVKDGHLDR